MSLKGFFDPKKRGVLTPIRSVIDTSYKYP